MKRGEFKTPLRRGLTQRTILANVTIVTNSQVKNSGRGSPLRPVFPSVCFTGVSGAG